MRRCAIAAGLMPIAVAQQTGHTQSLVPLKPGMVIRRSVTTRPGTYTLTAYPDIEKESLVDAKEQ